MVEKPPTKLLSEPLIRVRRESKRPVVGPKEVEPTQNIVEWVTNGGNAGICLDGSDLVVVDADTTEVAQAVVDRLPETFTVETGGNGFGVHYYFECPEWGRNASLSDGDSSIRTDGWMAVVPPSTHPDGGEYRVTRDIPIAELPATELEELADSLSEDRDTSGSKPGGTPRDRDELDELDELIHHDEKRAEIRAALEDRDAPHNKRQFVAGFLHRVVGLSSSEIVALIERYNKWADYDREVTEQQVESVIKSSGGSGR